MRQIVSQRKNARSNTCGRNEIASSTTVNACKVKCKAFPSTIWLHMIRWEINSSTCASRSPYARSSTLCQGVFENSRRWVSKHSFSFIDSTPNALRQWACLRQDSKKLADLLNRGTSRFGFRWLFSLLLRCHSRSLHWKKWKILSARNASWMPGINNSPSSIRDKKELSSVWINLCVSIGSISDWIKFVRSGFGNQSEKYTICRRKLWNHSWSASSKTDSTKRSTDGGMALNKSISCPECTF